MLLLQPGCPCQWEAQVQVLARVAGLAPASLLAGLQQPQQRSAIPRRLALHLRRGRGGLPLARATLGPQCLLLQRPLRPLSCQPLG